MLESVEVGQIIYALDGTRVCRFEVESVSGKSATCLAHRLSKGGWVRWKVDSWYRPVVTLALAFGSEIEAYTEALRRIKRERRALAKEQQKAEATLAELTMKAQRVPNAQTL